MKRIKECLFCFILITCFFIFSATISNVFASSKSSIDLKPKIDTTVGKYGYVDSKGKWVIKAQFEEAKDFSDGLAMVTYYNTTDDFYEARTGYINSKGKAAFNNRFYRANDFKDGYAAVTDKEEKLSIIDKTGKVVLKTNYYLSSMDCGVKGIHTIISDYAPSKYVENRKFGYITNKLRLVKPAYDGAPYYYVDYESNQSFPSVSYAENDSNERLIELHRYILNKNMEPVELPSDFIVGISEGVILMKCGSNFAYATLEGKIFDKIYDSNKKKYSKLSKAFNFSGGHAVVAVDNYLKDQYGHAELRGYGYLNKDGTTFKNPEYLYANSFKEGLAAVQPYPSWNFSMAILKADGEYLKEPEFRSTIKYEEADIQFMNIDHYSQGEYDYVKSEVKKIVKDITNDKMSDLEKITAINKYVCDHANYSIGSVIMPWEMGHPLYLDYLHESIGILKDGFGVCDAYTKLTGLLLQEAGIENKMVYGNAVTGKDDNHSWNLVKLNGKYYHLDTTWNDTEGSTNKYFLVSDQYMKSGTGGNRKWDTSKFPAAPKGYFNDKIQPK